MFASKLLNILEALPTDDEEHGNSSVLDTLEEMSKENENGSLSHSDGYKEANSSAFPIKDFLDTDVDLSCKETLACDKKDMDEPWKVWELDESVLSNDISRSNDGEVRVSAVEDDLNETLPNTITSRMYGNVFECDTKDRDEKWNTPEFECSIIPDLIDEKGNESVVPDARFTSGYKFFETDTKCVEEYELPELVVFYKESSWNNAKPGTYVSITGDEDQHSNTTESADTELSSAVGSKSSVESDKNEEQDTELPVPNDLKPGSPDEVYNDDDDSEDTYLEDLIMIFGSKGTAKWKHSNKLQETESSANVIPIPKESGFESYQQSKQPDQIPFEEAASESQNADNVPATNLFNHSKVATEASVFDFSSTKPASAINLDQGVENFAEPFQDVAKHGNKSLGDFLVYSQGYLADGEASFSASRPGSGPVISSRRIPSFGRTSVGSDSSTTSNGSFAFPILQSEWYSSPVRMVQVQEVEASHLPKPRSWKQGILCCHF